MAPTPPQNFQYIFPCLSYLPSWRLPLLLARYLHRWNAEADEFHPRPRELPTGWWWWYVACLHSWSNMMRPYFLRPILCSCCHHCSNEKNIDMHVLQKKHLAHLKKQPFRELSSSGLGSSEYFAEGCAEGSSIRTFTPHHRALHAPELLWHWPWALWPPTASCGRAVETCFRTAILVDIDVKEPL